MCPKCKNPNIINISTDGSRQYCPQCNSSWKKGTPITEGKLSFDGVIDAKTLLSLALKDQDVSPEWRCALETQLTSLLLDQWFEGFKAGQMASILYSKEYYGKDRTGHSSSNEGITPRTRLPSRSGKIRLRGSSEDPANRRDNAAPDPVTEGVCGVKFTYDAKLSPISDDIYRKIAELLYSTGLNKDQISSVEYDGENISVKFRA